MIRLTRKKKKRIMGRITTAMTLRFGFYIIHAIADSRSCQPTMIQDDTDVNALLDDDREAKPKKQVQSWTSESRSSAIQNQNPLETRSAVMKISKIFNGFNNTLF
jgi:hypothetical protein